MIFVDTGPLLARYLTRDQHHEDAVRGFEALSRVGPRLFTSNFVIDEWLTLLGRRASHGFAADRGKALHGSSAFTVLRPDQGDELLALHEFGRFADQGVSFTDCVSFALMQRERVSRAFTFDRHFTLPGFEVWTAD